MLACGRLDTDTTGLLLFSTDGLFVHHFQTKLSKIYQVKTKHKISQESIDSLIKGVDLKDGSKASALECIKISDDLIQLTILGGAYHQVKRMIGAIGNRVIGLNRNGIADMELDKEDLEIGKWKYLTKEDLEKKFLYEPIKK